MGARSSRRRGDAWRAADGEGLARVVDALAPVCAQLAISPLHATQAPA
jgi:hypothetical protein